MTPGFAVVIGNAVGCAGGITVVSIVFRGAAKIAEVFFAPQLDTLTDGTHGPTEIGDDDTAIRENIDTGVLIAHFIIQNQLQCRIESLTTVRGDDEHVLGSGVDMGAFSKLLLPFFGMTECTDDGAVSQTSQIGKSNVLLIPINGFALENLHDA